MVLMSAELMATIICTALAVITLGLTIYFTNKSTQKTLREGLKNTQKIIEEGNKNTQKILKGHEKILERIAHAIHSIAHLTEKVASHSVVGFELQGIKIAENVDSEEEAKKLGKLIKYNPTLKLAYYRPKSVA